MKRSISFGELWTFEECPQQYLALLMRKKQLVTKEQVVGNATHALAENRGEKTESVKRLIARELSFLPAEERDETLARIELVNANAMEMAAADNDDDSETERETVYRWLFEAMGWTVCAKPDRVEIVQENGQQILDILDYKSGSSYEYTTEKGVSYRPKRKHKEQIYFFALVVSKAMNWTGKIRMRIRYWGNKSECEPMWYSHYRTQTKLDELGRQLKRIEEYLAANAFPSKPGFWCEGCPRAAVCEANSTRLNLIAGTPLQRSA